MLRVVDRISKNVGEENVTATTRMVDGCVDILGLCVQTDITNKNNHNGKI